MVSGQQPNLISEMVVDQRKRGGEHNPALAKGTVVQMVNTLKLLHIHDHPQPQLIHSH